MRPGPLIALALAGLPLAALVAWSPGGGVAPEGEETSPRPQEASGRAAAGGGALKAQGNDRTGRAIEELRRAIDARPGIARRAAVTLGESARGRAIRAVAANGLGERPLVLVVGCIHGTECAGIEIAERMSSGRRPSGDGLVVVPNLNPDGRLLRIRTNAHGVDLNRNFASEWRPAGSPGDPQHSGSRPFSEPETRLVRRLIRGLRPDATVWFHQQAEPLVRASGPSVSAARAYARLAGTAFHRLPWLEGSAPNWQNNRFGGASSFVVELPLGEPSRRLVARHTRAIRDLAQGLERGAA